ncbi:MAG TPA: hypothetical protein VG603_13235 [Chitinophagales bacterium]|nr:hypothetical protein [Chitinophagales bacterium]
MQLNKKTIGRVGFIIVYSVVIFFVLEGVSYLILQKLHLNKSRVRFNRELSGYTVFKNTPDFDYWTYKEGDSGTDVITDKYGFICDEPVSLNKDSNTLRIFLMGGSAMLGAGQNANTNCYASVKPFPVSLYQYRISIAGYLKKYLQGRFPGKKIEVVNYAGYERQLHQSMLAYVTQVYRFKPDIVVNMDGFNDLININNGDIFERCEMFYLPEYTNMEIEAHAPVFRLRTARLIYYLMIKMKEYLSSKARAEVIPRTDNARLLMATTGTNNTSCGCEIDTAVYNHNTYLAIKDSMIATSAEWLDIINHYAYILKGDKVQFLFVMQPILARPTNKALAGYERNMLPINVLCNHNKPGKQHKGKAPEPTSLYGRLRLRDDWMDGAKDITLQYFLDDYLTGAIKQQADEHGYFYYDMGRAMQGLDSNFEFYTDYCHMTKEGNRFAAEKIGEALIQDKLITE